MPVLLLPPYNIWLGSNHPISAVFCDRWPRICKIDSEPAAYARIYSSSNKEKNNAGSHKNMGNTSQGSHSNKNVEILKKKVQNGQLKKSSPELKM